MQIQQEEWVLCCWRKPGSFDSIDVGFDVGLELFDSWQDAGDFIMSFHKDNGATEIKAINMIRPPENCRSAVLSFFDGSTNVWTLAEEVLMRA